MNCTITGNTAGTGGGGIFCSGASPSVTNCILWGDSPNEVDIESGAPTFTYCDIQGGYAGNGNINSNPLFVDAGAGDYRLQSSSPCVDAGTSDGTPTEDKDGTPRWDDSLWSTSDPDVLYCRTGLKLWQFNVAKREYSLVKDFTGVFEGAASLWQMSKSLDDGTFAFSIQEPKYRVIGFAAWKRDTVLEL